MLIAPKADEKANRNQFASAHQPWMNLDFIVLQLCIRPEMQRILREEIGDIASMDYIQLRDLPLLDSFIKETVRLHPLDTSKYWLY